MDVKVRCEVALQTHAASLLVRFTAAKLRKMTQPEKSFTLKISTLTLSTHFANQA